MSFATIKQPNPVLTEKSKAVLTHLIKTIGETVKQSKRQALIEDVVERAELGLETYRQRLSTFDGRCGLTDAYQEILDTVYYFQKELVETDSLDVEDAMRSNIASQIKLALQVRDMLDIKHGISTGNEHVPE